MKLTLWIFNLFVTSSYAFVVFPSSSSVNKALSVEQQPSQQDDVTQTVVDEIDFDAPIDRIIHAKHGTISPNSQYTIGLGSYFGSMTVPDFVSRAFLFPDSDDKEEIDPIFYTIGLGDVGTITIEGILNRDSNRCVLDPKDKKTYTIGLGELQGTIQFPDMMERIFHKDKKDSLTIGFGDVGTLTLGNKNNGPLEGHRTTIGLGGDNGVVEFMSGKTEETTSTPIRYTMGMKDMGTLSLDGTLEAVGHESKTDHSLYTIGLGEQGTMQFSSFMGQVMNHKDDITIGLGEFGTLTMASSHTLKDTWLSLMDDECYVGKNLDVTECVDFDPLH